MMAQNNKKRTIDEAFEQGAFDSQLGLAIGGEGEMSFLGLDSDLDLQSLSKIDFPFHLDMLLQNSQNHMAETPIPAEKFAPNRPIIVQDSPSEHTDGEEIALVATSPIDLSRKFAAEDTASDCSVSHIQLAGRNLVLVCADMETQWYADRCFPRFVVELRDVANGELAADISGWKVVMSVNDGYGEDASGKVYGQVHNHTYTLVDGRASITGLRFSAVSSKSGGHFTVRVALSQPAAYCSFVSAFESPSITVLSYRLYHAPKVNFEDLKPTDKVGKMKGIGTLYAKRFAAMGIKVVAQLAAIDVSKLGDEGCKQLLNGLRKDRGAMTLAKLGEYIQQARNIVARWQQANGVDMTATIAPHCIQLEKPAPSSFTPSYAATQHGPTSPVSFEQVCVEGQVVLVHPAKRIKSEYTNLPISFGMGVEDYLTHLSPLY